RTHSGSRQGHRQSPAAPSTPAEAATQAAHAMTGPHVSERIRALIDQLARNDRSTAFALHALIVAADENGVADFNRAVIAYRDDYLAAVRARGRDAQREAGRLSLDEVR